MFNALKNKKIDKQYRLLIEKPIPKHIGIILDGNGRWAKKQGLPRIIGHAQGIKRIKNIIPEVKKLGVEVLTLFVFSTENWNRPSKEVDFLMDEAKKNYEKMIDKLGCKASQIIFIDDKESDYLDEIKELILILFKKVA